MTILQKMIRNICVFIIVLWFFHPKVVSQQQANPIPDFLEYRNLGPHRAGSWLSSLAVPDTNDPSQKYTYYVGSRNGGVWKTVNNGTTFYPVFDSVQVGSIGAVAVSKSNPEIVWVGTGESYNARSSHAGKGVYKSMNGGKTWEHCGLDDTHHISAVIIHPDNPEVVFIAAMGHLFTPNEQRGVFLTRDGGQTWEKVLYIDQNTGIIDLVMNPADPELMFAASYEKYRYPWHYEAGGERSAIYRSTDQGETWEICRDGLPEGKIGRIGLGLCYHHPEIVYAVVENLNPKDGIVVDENVEMNYMRDPYFDQLIGGEVYRSGDSGITWTKQNMDSCNVSAKAAYSFNKILVHPFNPDVLFVSSDVLISSADGGKTWNDCSWPPTNLFVNMFGDIRTFWADPRDGDHMLIGSDGGLYETFDGGRTVKHLYHIPLGEVYKVEIDNAYPYNIYMGLQDHEAWKAPSNSWSGRIGLEDWQIVGMWDGMYTVVDLEDYRWAYISTQFGAHHRVDQLKGERKRIEPENRNGPPYRFPWTPPIQISHHNPSRIYVGAQCLIRSDDRGDSWEEISPDLTTNDPDKIAGRGHMMYCTITAISESEIDPNKIWVGTDDGRIHMTPDGGSSWLECTESVEAAGGNKDYWVSHIATSRYDEKTAFVCKSGFRNDDFHPLVFRTIDDGKSWNKITNGLPDYPVNVLIEDPRNKNILYLGNDQGVYLTFNQGSAWQSFQQNMPAVPVKDLKVQHEENDLIVGTYGRGAYVIDISLLQQFNHESLESDLVLFQIEPKPVRNFSERASWGNYEMTGDNHLWTPNEPNGLIIYYAVQVEPENELNLVIADGAGLNIDTLDINKSTGFHRVIYDTDKMQPGMYRVRLATDTIMLEQSAVLKPSPVWPVGHGFENILSH